MSENIISKNYQLNSLTLYLKEIGNYSVLSAEEEQQLGKEIANGNTYAKEQLINSNLKLVVSIAKIFKTNERELLELIQWGNLGLIRAVNKFDYTLGYKFSTYATHWIKQSIMRGLADTEKTIRLPNHMEEWSRKYFTTQKQLEIELGSTPSSQDIAHALNISVEKLNENLEYLKRTTSVTSMNRTLPEQDKDVSLENVFTKEDELTTEDIVEKAALENDINDLLYKYLKPREIRVLSLRYGLNDGITRTLDEVGKELGVTRERIRQIINASLAKLRGPAHRRNLEVYI